jgi:hypothetical protein
MQAFFAASLATASCPHWLKNAVRVALLLVIIQGTVWLAMSWLALRGFSGH